MNKWIAAAAITLIAPLTSAKVLISIDGGLGYGSNGLADDSTLMDNTFDLGGTGSTEPYGLGMEGKGGFYGWAKISLPVLPDVKVKYESMVLDGSNNVTFTEEIFGEEFSASGDVTSELDLSHLDLALTYGLPLPVVDIDLGLNFRSMIGGFSAEADGVDPIDESFKAGGAPLIIPMLYVSAEGMIPTLDVKLSGELSFLPLGDVSVTDWNIKGTWYAPLPTNLLAELGLEAGYRSFNMNIGGELFGSDLSEYATDVGVSGFFIGAAFHF